MEVMVAVQSFSILFHFRTQFLSPTSTPVATGYWFLLESDLSLIYQKETPYAVKELRGH